MTDEDLKELFSYHAPTPEQVVRYNELRAAALEFAKVINRVVPNSPDKSAAIRLLRESVMTANAGIALEDHYKFALSRS